MANKLTIKQENFCRAYIETGNASEAYRQAYNAENMSAKVIHNKACVLLKGGEVRVMLGELEKVHQKRHDVTVDSLTADLKEDRNFARDLGKASAAVAATMGVAKLHGLLTDKHEHTGKDGGPIETKDITSEIDNLFAEPSFKQDDGKEVVH